MLRHPLQQLPELPLSARLALGIRRGVQAYSRGVGIEQVVCTNPESLKGVN
jgi:hypothetical protein